MARIGVVNGYPDLHHEDAETSNVFSQKVIT
jgi:hypothetical protein